MHQLLLRIELLGTAVPVAIGFIDSLRLRFPILLLQIFPNIEHPQQGILGEPQPDEHSKVRSFTLTVTGSGAREERRALGKVGSQGLGSTWVPVEAGLEMSPSDLSSGYLTVRGLLRLHSNFSCYRGRGKVESGQH